MDILRILDQLNELAVERPRPIFGKLTYGLDKDEVSMQIAKVRASLPAEVKQAAATVRETDRIVETAREDAQMTVESARKEADRSVTEARREAEKMLDAAKKEADRLIEQAKVQQERMVMESEILKLSKAQSEEIRNSADRDAVQMRRGAEKYALDVLNQLEGVVGKVMTTIERGKQEMGRAEPNPQSRERIKV